jgi:hypothetical protein
MNIIPGSILGGFPLRLENRMTGQLRKKDFQMELSAIRLQHADQRIVFIHLLLMAES